MDVCWVQNRSIFIDFLEIDPPRKWFYIKINVLYESYLSLSIY